MENLIADLKKQLVAQRMELATNIKNSEENLLRTKEGFLKVEGALEIINIIETKLSEEVKKTDDEVVAEAVGAG
tara:strand:+ start:416 stop:637 length:222 start_codon:yes stop_codon:yes gene_type:complete